MQGSNGASSVTAEARDGHRPSRTASPTAALPGAVAQVLRRGRGVADRRARFRALVGSGRTFLVPGITDAMGALLVHRAGFPAGYVTGAGLANAVHGVPDVGLLGLNDLAPHVGRLTAATDIPLVVDADNGFGGPLLVARTVQELERAGAAAVQIEDQQMPKRCGHFDSHNVIPVHEMQAKIEVALQAREDGDLVVIARTDARSAVGLDEALRRAPANAAARPAKGVGGAPRTVAELERIGRELRGVPLVVNVVEGGKTPQLSFAEYEQLGYALVLHANLLMRSMMRAGAQALRRLADEGDSRGLLSSLSSWDERQGLFSLPEFLETDAFFDRSESSSDER